MSACSGEYPYWGRAVGEEHLDDERAYPRTPSRSSAGLLLAWVSEELASVLVALIS